MPALYASRTASLRVVLEYEPSVSSPSQCLSTISLIVFSISDSVMVSFFLQNFYHRLSNRRYCRAVIAHIFSHCFACKWLAIKIMSVIFNVFIHHFHCFNNFLFFFFFHLSLSCSVSNTGKQSNSVACQLFVFLVKINSNKSPTKFHCDFSSCATS